MHPEQRRQSCLQRRVSMFSVLLNFKFYYENPVFWVKLPSHLISKLFGSDDLVARSKYPPPPLPSLTLVSFEKKLTLARKNNCYTVFMRIM